MHIDGSLGEGGGQVLRTALALSVLTGRPLAIDNVRAGRANPGLQPQHLAAVQAAAAICGAALQGAKLGSRSLYFAPGGPPQAGNYRFDVAEIAGRGSAGSVGLLLQTVLLPLALTDGPSLLTLRGGTHVPWAPSVDYLRHVFLPTVARMGLQAEIELRAWGFYPAGGGEAVARIAGRRAALTAVDLGERGPLQRIAGQAVAGNLPSHIAQRIANRARNLLAGEWNGALAVEPLRVRSAGPGALISLWAAYEHAPAGFTSFGRKGLPSEQVAAAACEELLAHHRSGAPIDPHLGDQLLLPMALAGGASRMVTSAITAHLLTNVAVVQAFLSLPVQVEGQLGQPGQVTITGSGYD